MNTTITFKKEDYLTYQLFAASKSKRVKRNRLIGWMFFTIGSFIWAFNSYLRNDAVTEYFFIVFGIIALIFYPKYQRWFYKRHYRKHVEETRKGCFDEVCNIEISTDQILTSDNTSEMKVKTSEISEINEIQNYFFLKVKSGQSLMLRKDNFDHEILSSLINEIATMHNIPVNQELNWKWR